MNDGLTLSTFQIFQKFLEEKKVSGGTQVYNSLFKTIEPKKKAQK